MDGKLDAAAILRHLGNAAVAAIVAELMKADGVDADAQAVRAEIAELVKDCSALNASKTGLGAESRLPPKKVQIESSGLLIRGRTAPNAVTVFAGQKVGAVSESFASNSKAAYDLRLRLEETGVIRDGEIVDDYTFQSPSAAAAVVTGRFCAAKDWTVLS